MGTGAQATIDVRVLTPFIEAFASLPETKQYYAAGYMQGLAASANRDEDKSQPKPKKP